MGSPAQNLRGNTRSHICLHTHHQYGVENIPSLLTLCLPLSAASRSILTLTRWPQHQTFRVLYQCSYPEPHRVPTPISTASTASSQQKDVLAVFLVPTPESAPAWKTAVFCWKTPSSPGDQEHLPSQTE